MSGAAPASPVGWLPSWDRTTALFGTVCAPPRGMSAAILPRVWPPKDAGSMLDYSIDCTNWLAPLNDTLAGCVASGTADLVVVLIARIGYRAVLWLSGGTPGVTYAVTLALTSAAGQAVTVPVTLIVTGGASFGTPAVPGLSTQSGDALETESSGMLTVALGQFGSASVTEGGAILTTQSGSLLTV